MLSFKSFIDEDYKTTTAKFVASGIDKDQVDEYIKKFKELSNKQKLAGDEKNIDTWSKKAFSEFKEFVDAKETEVAVVANKKAEKKDPGTSFDITTPEQRSAGWKIIIPLDKKASVFYGNLDCMSDWCVAKTEHDYFNKYFYEKNSNLIFCLNDKKEKWAIEIESDGSTIIFYDIKDNEISKSEFEKQTKLNFDDILRSYEPFIEKIKAFKQPNFDKISLAKLQQLKSKFPDATLETWHTHPNGKGWVQNTANVSASAFVGPDAIVYGNAEVYGKARVIDNARVFGGARVSDKAVIADDARVSGYSVVIGAAVVYGNALVDGAAWIEENAKVGDDAKVYEKAGISGSAEISGKARVFGYARISGNAQVGDDAQVFENAGVSGNAVVSGNARVSGRSRLSGNAEVFGNTQVSGNQILEKTKH